MNPNRIRLIANQGQPKTRPAKPEKASRNPAQPEQKPLPSNPPPKKGN